MAASLFWVGVPYAFMSVSHDFWMLLVCVTLVGIGNNIWHPAAIPTLAYRYPQRKGLVLSFHGMGGNIGEALAPVVVGALLGWFTWRQVVVINVVPGIAMAVLILLLLGAFTARDPADDNAINAGGEKRTLRAIPARLRDAAAEQGADARLGELGVPHHDAGRPAHVPARSTSPTSSATRR